MNKLLATAALLTLAGAAQAQLSYSGGSARSFVDYSNSDILYTGAVSFGIENALISAAGAGGTLSVTFLGKEAGNHNTYSFELSNTSSLVISNTDSAPKTLSGVIAGGALNFSFKDLTDGDSVRNGGQQTDYASYALLGTNGRQGFVANTGGGRFDYVLGFNDGAHVDADYDDLVVGIKLIPAVPEPETYALLLGGLGIIGFVARRRQRQA